ncbi:Uroporphyrinogen-III C-methyltransferase [uncultured archaeon]|nr:Uroporphyrinogen-III C-methyltransferase [uncultured archaeon]
MPSVNKPSHKLSIVGLGPGNRKQMTFQAARAVQGADYVVGYKPYLELIEDLLEGKQVISSSMGKEVERAKTAVDLLSDGSVALVSSGDPNIYGMAGLGLELASAREDICDVEVVPGVTSFAAAACRAGIVFRESVAVISLSDLLTPWSRIEERLNLAAEYRMPTAIYNPMSRRRDWQLKRALEIYGPDTDVLMAKNVARIGEELHWTKAGALLDLEEREERIDMFTVLILDGVGMIMGNASSQTRINIVGIGPGSPDKLTYEAQSLLKGSSKIFGASRYLQEIDGLSSGEKIMHQGSYAQRMALRFVEAKAASERGLQTSILTGGDPSIFSSAWRIFEEAGDCGLHLCPGISAFSAVAARAGAPLVNDFVLLSGTVDPSRIKRLAMAEFGMVIYNIAGQNLPAILAEIDLSRPCVLARDVARDEEAVLVMNASDLMEARPNGFRFTLIVASAESYIKDGRIITRRGYQTKYSY